MRIILCITVICVGIQLYSVKKQMKLKKFVGNNNEGLSIEFETEKMQMIFGKQI